jgi:hypothetical protein
MAKVTIISPQQSSTELEAQNFTQVGGIYGEEIKPEEYLVPADIMQCTFGSEIEQANHEREPRFFRVK